MKTKGITVWEQYLERMIVAVAVLFLVGFGAWQFMRQPNVVESRGHTLRPSDADEQLLKKAAEISKKLDAEAPPPVEIPDASALLEEFRLSLVASISPGVEIQPTEPRVAIVGYSGTKGPTPDVPYVEPVIVAPQKIVAAQYFNGLASEALEAHASLKEEPRFAQAPYDLTWITAAARFDLASVRSAFSTPGPNGERPFPTGWYGDQIRAIDVKMERETKRDGSWTDRTVLSPIPGQVSFRAELEGSMDKARGDDLLARLAAPGTQRAVVQPDFLPLVGDPFVPPDPRAEVEAAAPDDAGAKPEDAEYRAKKRKRDRLWQQRQSKAEEVKKLGGTLEPTGGQTPPGSGATPGTGGDGSGEGGRPAPGGEKGKGEKTGRAAPGLGGGGGPGMVSGEAGGTRRGSKADDRIAALKGQIGDLDAAIGKLDERLKALRPDTEIASGDGVDDGIGAEGFTGGEVVIWAHDISAKPGEIYRYRFVVEIQSPFFARRINLSDEQKHLADRFTLASEPSEWSAELEVQPFTEIFVTSAHATDPEHPERARGTLRMGQAQAEVWRFRNARWEDQQFGVEPGDRVGWKREDRAREEGAAPREIDFGTDWFVLDIVDDIDVDSRTDRENGYAAIVWLQSLTDPAKRLRLSPREAMASQRRQWLRDQVEARTDAEGELAQGE